MKTTKLTMLLGAFALALGFTSCSSSDDVITDNGGNTQKEGYVEAYKTPDITLLAGTDTLKTADTRATAAEANVKDSKGYFFIRIDNRIQDENGGKKYDSSKYYPLTWDYRWNGYVTNFKLGATVKLDYNFNKGVAKNVPLYVYDVTGVETLNAIDESTKFPTIAEIFAANDKSLNVALPANTDTLKVIWYVVKYQTGDGHDCWHIDGVLTSKNTKSIKDIPGMGFNDTEGLEQASAGMVEANLGLQVRKDNDLCAKLAVHVRDTTDITVKIPVDTALLVKQDDTFIVQKHYEHMVYGKTLTVGDQEVTVKVSYDEDGITVSTSGITAEVQKICRQLYQDGLTIEVYTYFNPENATKAKALEAMNKATISFTGLPKTYFNAVCNGTVIEKEVYDLDAEVKPEASYTKSNLLTETYEETTENGKKTVTKYLGYKYTK